MHSWSAWTKYFFIAVFVVPALLAFGDAGRVIWEYFSQSPDPNPIHFSGKQVTLLSEAAKVLIPTISGFAVLAGSGLGFLQSSKPIDLPPVQIAILAVCALIVIALASWIFALAVSIDCGYPFDPMPPRLPEKGPFSPDCLNDSWAKGLLAAKLGTISFFISLDVAAAVVIAVLTDIFGMRSVRSTPAS
jgi:hypothetical protein